MPSGNLSWLVGAVYSAFNNFGPAPKFGHFWRFSE